MGTIFNGRNGQLRPLWRIVIFLIFTVLIVLAVNIGWRLLDLPPQRTDGQTQAWPFLAFASLVSGGSFILVALLLRAIEGVGLSAIGLPFRKNAISDTFKGTLLGAIPVSLMMIYALLSGYGAISFNGIEVKALLSAVAPLLLAGFLLAAWEELTLRGYLLRQLSISLTPLGAALITGIIFGLLHSGNPGANWEGVLYTAAGGMLMALLMFRTGSLWLLIGYHFGWNTTGSVIFGLDLSGFSESSTIFNSTLTGEDWLTGGNYGFEASLPIVVAEVVVLGAACLFCNRSSKPADFIPQ